MASARIEVGQVDRSSNCYFFPVRYEYSFGFGNCKFSPARECGWRSHVLLAEEFGAASL